MSQTVLIHMTNEDPIVAEIEAMPERSDILLTIQNPRRRDGKDLHYLQPEVQTIILPFHRISFIEVMPSGEHEEVFSFIREK